LNNKNCPILFVGVGVQLTCLWV